MTTELGVNTTTAATYGNTAGRMMAASAYGPPARRPASAHGPSAVGEPAARRTGHPISGPGSMLPRRTGPGVAYDPEPVSCSGPSVRCVAVRDA